MQVQTYLYFDGHCEEALAFYQKVLDAQIDVKMRFKDCPDKSMITPGTESKIMHAQFRIGQTTLLASDGHCQGKGTFEGFGLTLFPATDAQAASLFAALGEGGKVTMPLTRTFYATRFGMLNDRFGVAWIVLVSDPSYGASKPAEGAAR
jgi:PhnB protein